MSDNDQVERSSTESPEQPASVQGSDEEVFQPQGGIVSQAAGVMAAPVGGEGGVLALEADITKELAQLAPAFGDVLSSIGLAVAASQASLDKSLVDTAKKLSDTKIKVVSEVIQELDDDGLPDVDKTQLITNDVALINFVSPTVHEWQRVALSMDFSVGAIDNETGVRFNRFQHRTNIGGGGRWGFLGWFNVQTSTTNTNISTSTDYEANWATGQIRLDAMLGPRQSENFPAPAEIQIGPQIFFSQGPVTETQAAGNTTRSIDVVIKVLKANGANNPNVGIVIESQFAPSFSNTAPFTGSQTNSDGEIKVTFTRTVPAGFRATRGNVTARLGGISRTTQISL